jgi:hypothetical protein
MERLDIWVQISALIHERPYASLRLRWSVLVTLVSLVVENFGVFSRCVSRIVTCSCVVNVSAANK